MMVSRVLKKINEETNNLEIESIDILLHPRIALHAGITMIPTLQLDEKRLSGVFLSEGKIRDFLKGD